MVNGSPGSRVQGPGSRAPVRSAPSPVHRKYRSSSFLFSFAFFAAVGLQASAEPTDAVVLLRAPGTAGAAETGIVLVGAKPGVNDEPAVGEFGLVHAVWQHINTCSSTDVCDAISSWNHMVVKS